MIATISSEVPTGRSMNIRDGFMSRPGLLVGLRGSAGPAAFAVGLASPLRRGLGGPWIGLAVGRRGGDRRTGRRARVRAGPADLGAGAQAVGAVDDDPVADLQARGALL